MRRQGFVIGIITLAASLALGQEGETFVRGDVDGSGNVDKKDVKYLDDWLKGRGDPPACYDAADADDDGVISHADAVFLRTALNGPNPGSEIPPPYPEEGPDPTVDDPITCDTYTPADDVGPVDNRIRIALESGAAIPGAGVGLRLTLHNTIGLEGITAILQWDPSVLAFAGVSIDAEDVAPQVASAVYEVIDHSAEGWIAIEISDTYELFPPLAKNEDRIVVGYVQFLVDPDAEAPRSLKIDLPPRACLDAPGYENVCVYAVASAGDEALRPRTFPGSVSTVKQNPGGVAIVQEVVGPVDGVPEDPLAEVSAIVEYDAETGEGTVSFPDLLAQAGGLKSDGETQFCYFPAQAHSALLRSVIMIHGLAMPGASNLADLTDASSIVLEIIDQYPIEDPRLKSSSSSFPLGSATIALRVNAEYPSIEWFSVDISELDWKRILCPPASHIFEWSRVSMQNPALVEFDGDYSVGYERPYDPTQLDFYSYRRLLTYCVPAAGSFRPIPDQLVTISGSFHPELAAWTFSFAILPSEDLLFIRGDSNGDGRIDIGDAVSVLSYLFLSGVLNGLPDAADANDDGRIDIGDVISILAYLFDPQSPGMLRAPCWKVLPERRGVDPTDDDL